MFEKIWPNELTQFAIDIIKKHKMYHEDIDTWDEELNSFLWKNMNHEDQKWGEGEWEEYYVIWKLSNWDYIKVDSIYNSWDSNQFENAYKCSKLVWGGWWSKQTQKSVDLVIKKIICEAIELWYEVKELSSYTKTSENPTT